MTTTHHHRVGGLAVALAAALLATLSPGLDRPAVAGTVADSTIVPDPSWTCGAPDGIVTPTRGELIFRATLQTAGGNDAGTTQYGHRRSFDVTAGTVSGSRVQGTALTGGLDLELTLANGAMELEQRIVLRLNTGALVLMRNCGVAPAGEQAVRLVGDFEAPNSSSHAWLNTGKYAGTRTINPATGAIEITMYDVSGVEPTEPRVQLTDPTGVANQTWDCKADTGARGAAVFSETVRMGASLSVGQSKRGNRNIMPVAGGTTSGRVVGSVLPGGADLQLLNGANPLLDARYTISTRDGEFILVRNCGPMNSLTPAFEARPSGPYAFLTKGKYMSVATATGADIANVTFYERT